MADYPSVKLFEYSVFSGDEIFFSNGFEGVINTINPHSYIVARGDVKFRDALLEGNMLVADGVGITIATRLLTGRNIMRIPGSDLHEMLVSHLGENNGSCFYLGSKDATLERIIERLGNEHPGIRAGCFSPPFKTEFSQEDSDSMIKSVNAFKPEVLFVGMTAPKQEKWVHEHSHNLDAKIICSVGAVFDFYAGTKKRPGKFWRKTGLEWLPRFFMEPGRLWQRNFVSMPLFIWYVIVEKIRLILRLKN
jgi:N-acetylglucosaminyldiphosphoundecaprenol N-acetyl-beta-D-mannosaminyltransferase